MKKNILILASAALVGLVSCAKDATEALVPTPEERTFRVELPASGLTESRTAMTDAGKVSWNDGDAISVNVLDAEDNVLQDNVKFCYDAENNCFVGTCHAHADIDWTDAKYQKAQWFAIYPYQTSHSYENFIGTLPTSQPCRFALGTTNSEAYAAWCSNVDVMTTGIQEASYEETELTDGNISLVLPAGGIVLKFDNPKTSIVKVTIPAIDPDLAKTLGVPTTARITRVTISAPQEVAAGAETDDYFMTGTFKTERESENGGLPFTHVHALAGEQYAYWAAASEDQYINPFEGAALYFVVNATPEGTELSAGTFRVVCTMLGGELTKKASKAISFPAGSLKSITIPWGKTTGTDGFSTTVDVSASGSANCYVVAPNRSYRFTTKFRGNGVDTKYKTTAADATEYLRGTFDAEELASMTDAKLVWEVANSDTAADDVNVIDGNPTYNTDKNEITFTTGSKDGNAVIAVTDAGGAILWSWHIWVTSDAATIFNAQNVSSRTRMMDRNLGAGRSAKAITDKVTFADRGLYYQWGRKDPFVANFTDKNNIRKGDGTGWGAAFADKKTETPPSALNYSIANPSTYLMGGGTNNSLAKDWYTSDKDISRGNTLWNGGILYKASAATYKTSAEATVDGKKSMFDPCPRGYRMPISGVWGLTNTVKTNLVGTWYYASNSWFAIPSDATSKSATGGHFIESLSPVEYSFYPQVGALQDDKNAKFTEADNVTGLRYWTASMNGDPNATDKTKTTVNTAWFGGTVYIMPTANEPFNFAPKADCRPVRCVQVDYFTNHLYENQ